MRAAIYEAFEGPITVRDLPDPCLLYTSDAADDSVLV